MSKKPSGLGKGLSALLSDAGRQPDVPEAEGHTGMPVSLLAVGTIEPNPYQPRKYFDQDALQELTESISLQGVIQPVTVRGIGAGRYQLIAGERRWQASKKAGLAEIPAFVRTATDQQMMEIAIIENIQREDLNAMEVARSLSQLMTECHLRQEELADRVGKKRSTVANYLRLLKLPPDISEALDKDVISMGHARAILGLDAIDKQLFAFGQVQKRGLSVRQTEALVQDLQNAKKTTTSAPAPKPGTELQAVLQQLNTRLGTKVAIKQKGEAGEISIPYKNLDELNRVLEILL
jgi:ParB family chromosome partitioning protein